MSNENKPPAQKTANMPLFMGLFATLLGVFIILVSVDIIPADSTSIHAPRWVLTLAGMIFAFAGLYILSTGLTPPGKQASPIVLWIQYFLRLGMLTAFAATFLWVGFGSGEREFSGSGSFLFFTISGNGGDIPGRIVFGGGGLLAALITGFFAVSEARKIMNNTTDHGT
jgi:hypothetical protein